VLERSHGVRVNKALRRKFGFKREEETRGWKKLNNE
jgi:hypothetical protein